MVPSFSKREIYEVKNMVISSVENGNVGKVKDEDVYVAFSGKIPGLEKSVKVILKGKQAVGIYNVFLQEGNTACCTIDSDGLQIDKKVVVSFIGLLKEKRAKEIVLSNPGDIRFDYSFVLLEDE